MKKLKKLSVAIVALAMCALLGISVWAANILDVSYTATLDNANLCVTDAVQEATMTVKVSSKVDMDSFTAQLIVPEGLTVKEVKFGDLTNAIYDETENMIIWWSTSADDVNNDILAVVTVEVPANAEGTYEIGFEIIDISSDYGYAWETGDTVSATLTVADHEWNEPTYTDNGDGTHTAKYTCKNNASHTKSDAPVEHDFTAGDCVCEAKKPATGLKGDVDLDGEAGTLEDVTMLARHYMGYEVITNTQSLTNGDIDENGTVELEDLTALARFYMGYDETLE